MTVKIEKYNKKFEQLKKELLKLRKMMDYKNSSFYRKSLDDIIKLYFVEKRKEVN